MFFLSKCGFRNIHNTHDCDAAELEQDLSPTLQSELFYSLERPSPVPEMVPVLMLMIMYWSTGLQTQVLRRPPGPEDVRLVEGNSRCAGRVEVKLLGEWKSVDVVNVWTLKNAAVVCKELGCGSAVSTRRIDKKHTAWLFESNCFGSESALRNCGSVIGPSDTSSAWEVICSESVRLVNGAGLCSGRVEVRSGQSWTSVCDADFDRKDAEVVCRELNCGPPSALQGALYGKGSGPLWVKEFQCEGNESRLLDCDSSDSATNTCSPANAVGLTCSGPEDVRLVEGGSRCAGRVELKHEGEWRSFKDGYQWNLRSAAIMCRQLDCGSAVSTIWKSGEDRTLWELKFKCVGSESALRECGSVMGKSNSNDILEVICSESVRLVNGAGLCSGRVEVRSGQSWTSVCDADFDRKDAEVVCRELNCGPPLALQGALYAKGSGPLWVKEFQCEGNESHLLDCDTSDSATNTCSPGNAVGLTCSGPEDVRLVEGGSRCAGRVEVKQLGEWRSLTSVFKWTQKPAAVVCRQLGCGFAVSTKEKSGEDRTAWQFLIDCTGSESSLRDCVSIMGPSKTADVVEVICSEP